MSNKLFIFVGLYFSTISAEELSLQQAVVISRHGSRTLLTKDHKTFEEASDSQLTVRGMDQMFRAGEFVHSHFHEMKFNFSDLYSKSPQEIYVRSSDYSRTLNSALSFLLGLYPPRNQTLNVSYVHDIFHAPYDIQQVPIHTVAVENDQLLRGWLSCPELTKKVTAFYESKTFQEREAESASLRKTLANVLGIEKIELKDFYNVYDYVNLHRMYNHTFSLNITEKEWDKIESLADWVEYNKYSKGIIGDIGGGLLANEIAMSFKNVTEKPSKLKLRYYSAHYPTMLSLFTSLGLIKDSQSPLSKIPNYASLVFIELLRDSKNKYFVQFSFKNSSLEETVVKYNIPPCGDPCPLDQFVNLVTSLTVRDVTSWCHACKNTKLSQCKPSAENGQKTVCPAVKKPKLSGTGGFFLGVFVTLLVVIFITAVWHFWLRRRCLPGGSGRRPRIGLADLENVPSTGVI